MEGECLPSRTAGTAMNDRRKTVMSTLGTSVCQPGGLRLAPPRLLTRSKLPKCEPDT